MVKVKICGLMTAKDVAKVNYAQPDLAGFVFAKGRHQIDLQTAQNLRQKLAPRIKAVGVFVDESFALIQAAYQTKAIDLVQLHGPENRVLTQRIQADGIPVIQVFEQLDLTSPADYLMVDSGQGSGKTLAWYSFPQVDKPIILAGGLTPDNVQRAIQLTGADIADVSSGVETNQQKDLQKIKQFIENAGK